MRGLLTTLAAVVIVDVALVVGADRQPVATVVTQEPIGTPSRAAPRGGAAIATTASSGTAPVAVACRTPAPTPTWACQDGIWVMVAVTPSAGGGTVSTGAANPDGGAGNCLGAQPGAGWTCRGGAWTPPFGAPPSPSSASLTPSGSPAFPSTLPEPAGTDPSSPAGAPSAPSPSGCVTPNPAAGLPGLTARCVNGTWVFGG